MTTSSSGSSGDREYLVEQICRVVESIPAGCVSTYGTVAQIVGTGPRQVGQLIQEFGATVPWWRLVNAKGRLPRHLVEEAASEWEREKTPFNAQAGHVDMRAAMVDAATLLELARGSLREMGGFEE